MGSLQYADWARLGSSHVILVSQIVQATSKYFNAAPMYCKPRQIFVSPAAQPNPLHTYSTCHHGSTRKSEAAFQDRSTPKEEEICRSCTGEVLLKYLASNYSIGCLRSSLSSLQCRGRLALGLTKAQPLKRKSLLLLNRNQCRSYELHVHFPSPNSPSISDTPLM